MRGQTWLLFSMIFSVFIFSSFAISEAQSDPQLYFGSPTVALGESNVIVYSDSSKIDSISDDVFQVTVISEDTDADPRHTKFLDLIEIDNTGNFTGIMKFGPTASGPNEILSEINYTLTVEQGALSDDAVVVTNLDADPIWPLPIIILEDFSICDNFGGDRDKDGICDNFEDGDLVIDHLEEGGTDVYFYDCEPACDNSKKDIFLEIDYMQGHGPTQLAIDHLKDVFANSGVDDNTGRINPNGGTEKYENRAEGSALDLDGSSFVTLANPTGSFEFDISDPFSISFWMKKPDNSGTDVVISDKEKRTQREEGWVLYTTNNEKIHFRMADGSNVIQSRLDTPITGDGWHHIVAVWSGVEPYDTSAMTFYLDGKIANSVGQTDDTVISSISNSDDVIVGATSNGQDQFDGEIDDLRIYDFNLDSDGDGLIDLNYSLPRLAHYPFEDNLEDISGNDNHGSPDGTPGFDIGTAGATFDFDGSTYITLDYSKNFDFEISDSFSIAFWLTKPVDSGTDVVISKKLSRTGLSEGWALYTTDLDKIHFRISDGKGVIQSRAETIIADNTPHHIVAIWTGGNSPSDMKFYVDGTLASVKDQTPGITISHLSNSNSVIIGATSDEDNKYNGEIDDLRIYDFELSTSQIQDLLNDPFNAPPSLTQNMFEGNLLDSMESGIRLHVQIDPDDTSSIPHKNMTAFDDPGIDGFHRIKANFFGTETERASDDWHDGEIGYNQKAQAFHYVLFAHQLHNSFESGKADPGGNDIIITLGTFPSGVGTVEEQESTLLHEIGHNLNLTHGGGDSNNCKPNYPSVMSYTRQFPVFDSDRRLDFSRAILGTMSGAADVIDENNLFENEGIGHYEESMEDSIIYLDQNGIVNIASTSVSCIDWDTNVTGDCNNANDPHDINNFMTNEPTPVPLCPGEEILEKLYGHDDWDNIQLDPRGEAGILSGATHILREIDRPEEFETPEITEWFREIDRDGVKFLVDQSGNPAWFIETTPTQIISQPHEQIPEPTPDVMAETPELPGEMTYGDIQTIYVVKLERYESFIKNLNATSFENNFKQTTIANAFPLFKEAKEKIRMNDLSGALENMVKLQNQFDKKIIGKDKEKVKGVSGDLINSFRLSLQVPDPTIKKFPGPRIQIKNGTDYQEVDCNKNRFLLVNHEKGDAICLKELTEKKIKKISKWKDHVFPLKEIPPFSLLKPQVSSKT